MGISKNYKHSKENVNKFLKIGNVHFTFINNQHLVKISELQLTAIYFYEIVNGRQCGNLSNFMTLTFSVKPISGIVEAHLEAVYFDFS